MAFRIFIAHDLESYLRSFRTEDDCVDVLIRRFAAPPACRRCRRPTALRRQRRAWVCSCGASLSIAEGTPFFRMKVPLRVAFHALGRMMLRPTSISALQLVREGHLRRYATAWDLLRRLRAAIEARLFTWLRFGQGAVPRGGWCTQMCGRTRRKVPPGWVVFRSDAASEPVHVDVARERQPEPKRAADDDTRLLLENLRAVLVGTHHGVTARYLFWYAVEHVARSIRMPVETMWA